MEYQGDFDPRQVSNQPQGKQPWVKPPPGRQPVAPGHRRHQPPFPGHHQKPIYQQAAPVNGPTQRIVGAIRQRAAAVGLNPNHAMRALAQEVNGFNAGVQVASLGLIPAGGVRRWLPGFRK